MYPPHYYLLLPTTTTYVLTFVVCNTVDGKIRDLDNEMRRYKEALQKTPTGPAAANIKRRAMDTLKRKVSTFF